MRKFIKNEFEAIKITLLESFILEASCKIADREEIGCSTNYSITGYVKLNEASDEIPFMLTFNNKKINELDEKCAYEQTFELVVNYHKISIEGFDNATTYIDSLGNYEKIKLAIHDSLVKAIDRSDINIILIEKYI